MKSFVTSQPAEDFLDLCLVLMTSPVGRTTVWNNKEVIIQGRALERITYDIQEPFSSRSPVPDSVGFAKNVISITYSSSVQ